MTMLEQIVETKSWKASNGLAKCSKWMQTVWPIKGKGRTSFG